MTNTIEPTNSDLLTAIHELANRFTKQEEMLGAVKDVVIGIADNCVAHKDLKETEQRLSDKLDQHIADGPRLVW